MLLQQDLRLHHQLRLHQNNYKSETITETKEYQKIKITNLTTGDVEYIESFLKNGKYEFLTTNKDGRTSIEKVNGTIISTNLDTKVVKYQPIVTSNKPTVNSSIVVRNSALMVPLGGGWEGCYPRFYSASATVYNDVGATAAFLALCVGGPVTGGILIVATWAVNAWAPCSYWYTDYFVDSYDNSHFRDDTTYFKYSDYTSFVSTSTWAFYL